MRQRRLTFLLLGAGASALFVAACAQIFGVHNADEGDASVSEGGTTDGPPPYDANKDAISVGDANFAQCDGGTDDTTGAVFVSTSHPNKNSTNCGAATQPCSTIKAGIAAAVQTTAKKVILADDKFDEVVELDGTTNGVTIEGGYHLDYTQKDQNGNPAWVYQCSTGLAQIISSQSPPYVVRINKATGVTLRLMTIQSRGAATYGESVYGIQVIDSQQTTLDNVVVLSENAGDGLPGAAGTTQQPTSCMIDGGGNSGSSAGAGGAGTFQADGYHPAAAPSGQPGDFGNYTPPQQGVCNVSCISSCFTNFSGDGGATPTCGGATMQQCGSYGDPGCTGARGTGGGGGNGGGATVALFIYGSSSVTLQNGTSFLTAGGGTGGDGANGGNGAAGSTGAAGVPATCITSCGYDGGFCQPATTTQLAGGPGGVGGQGGSGGHGGGGAGGPSYLVVRVQPATLTPTSVSSINDAGPGPAGDGGAPNGLSGDRQWLKVF